MQSSADLSLIANATMLNSGINASVVRDIEEVAVLATNIKTSLVVKVERVCTLIIKARAFSAAFNNDFS